MQTWAYVSPLLGLTLLFFAFVCFQPDDEDDLRRRKRLVATPTTRIADATGRGVVELCGRVVADPTQETLRTPFTNKPSVWQRVSLEYLFGSEEQRSWVHLAAQVTARNFLLDDGSGEQARIVLEGDGELDVDINADLVKELARDEEHPPVVREFIEAVNVHARGHSLRFYESPICEGDTLVVIGPSTRERVVSEGYRDEVTRLVLSPGKGVEDALFLTKTTERARLAESRWFKILGVVLAILGVAVLATGGYCIYRLVVK